MLIKLHSVPIVVVGTQCTLMEMTILQLLHLQTMILNRRLDNRVMGMANSPQVLMLRMQAIDID